MYQEILKRIRPEFDKTLMFLEGEIAKIRTSRASPSLVEDIQADCFGQRFPLKQLAAISTPNSRQILIQPWDKSYIGGIVKALEQSSIGTAPIVDKDAIRISLPPLSEEYRKNLFKVLSEKQEEARKGIKYQREEAWKEIQDGFKEGKIREDDKFRGKDELQNLVDEYNEKIEQLGEKKKKEIME
ncbi:MAG: ribosome recycling factor [Candidatus Nealsonbacteria bacterium CG_4_10_14_0_2_um_filter_38_17]|uniref:Ribosome recycling factor n=2 Tax=Candidatus Nealsoniibacteriota TaxID=1817911 RepID=A0A2M7UXN7_9BACT|nr:MAG: ribosome recycling factor [Candidatus Nealsonbacteria bacterium CG23_combo_of_CG06-09_8_20_14_all_38_19]PIZ88753.1 MAG: ribosome recycling factor [Candidatus Nealsonbacteria bacterium CG_4_10_14_0_2_um_filter_38_17]